MTVLSHPWLDDEPRLLALSGFVARRALRRPILTVIGTLTLAGLLCSMRLSRVPFYEATATLRIAEGFVTRATPTPPGALRTHVATMALTRTRLARVMTKYRIGDPELASSIDEFKENLEIHVGENYFSNFYDPEPGTRSALLILEYTANDPDRARGVVHDIARAVVEEQEHTRAARIALTRALFQEALEQSRARLHSLEVESRELLSDVAEGVYEASSRLSDIELRKRSSLAFANALQQRHADIELAGDAEQLGVALRFEVVDEHVTGYGLALTHRATVVLFVILFLVALPLVMLVVGSFNSRVYDRRDLERLGIPCLGIVPGFNGDAAWSAAERRRRTKL